MISKYFELQRYVHFVRKRLAMRGAQPSSPAAWKRPLLCCRKGHAQYTIVSACYNVATYLPDYFDSLIGQRLDFRNNIHVICVDDGSTDDTAAIIQQYAKRYPENITYIYKENGGQASARNLGFRHVRTPWVSFVDPDDFLDYNCLYEADRHLAKHPEAALLSMKVLFYREEKHSFESGHPLDYKYTKACTALPITCMGDYVQLFTNSALFRTDIIRDNKLEGDSRIKPSFEDAQFVARYLLCVQDKEALFLKNAKYYYRKRADGTSTLDSKYKRKALFCDILKYGYLDVLQRYATAGITHDYAKRLFLYDVLFVLKDCVQHPELLNALSAKEKATYLSLLRDCFAFISADELESIDINGFNWFWKLAAEHAFHERETDLHIAVPSRYDTEHKQVWLRLFCGSENPQIAARIGNRDIPILSNDKRLYCLAGRALLEEHILRIPLDDDRPLQIFCNDKPAAICLWHTCWAYAGICNPKRQQLTWLPGPRDFLVNAAGKKITHYFNPAPEHDFTLSLSLLQKEWGNLGSRAEARYVPARMFSAQEDRFTPSSE